MNEEATVLTDEADGVLVITINRPEAKNAVNLSVAQGVAAALEHGHGAATCGATRRRPGRASAPRSSRRGRGAPGGTPGALLRGLGDAIEEGLAGMHVCFAVMFWIERRVDKSRSEIYIYI